MKQVPADWWLHWLLRARTLLVEHRSVLNRINVFPVADADTGANLAATIGRAADTAGMADEPSLGLAARAALRAARGNSGTLISVWLGGLAQALEDSQALAGPHPSQLTPASLNQGLAAGAHAARAALSQPVEGTMLTLMDHLAHRPATGQLEDYLTDLCAASEEALRATASAEQARNGWVDAGALGFHLILLALVSQLTGTEPAPTYRDLLEVAPASLPTAQQNPKKRAAQGTHPNPSAVEVMCSIYLPVYEITQLRSALETVGESVTVAQIEAGNEALWAVHVHVDQPETALQLIRAAAEPIDVRITALATEHQEEPNHHDASKHHSATHQSPEG